jgi:uncharacterized protein YbbC (DUF1343 family)
MMRRAILEVWIFGIFLSVASGSCAQKSNQVMTGADQIPAVLSKLKAWKVALLVNQTSVVGKTHLVDSLKTLGVDIKKIFSPEHGFRGNLDAGEAVSDEIDRPTGIPIISLYGSNKKPQGQQLESVDVVVFDIQDVGARFYTYISTLHYLMEACAENGKKVIVLDRPNPNGAYVDGPILQKEFKSFVGMHPIPIVHGMTIGEYAMMINGEGWLVGGKKCELEIVQLKNWKHIDSYSIPIKPSPNLPNDHAIALYPSTCLFEGTVLSLGRGTQYPFEIVGHPELKEYDFKFTPVSIAGMAKNPVLENQLCLGLDLRKVNVKKQLDLSYLIEMYNAFPDKSKFFIKYFNTLAGNKTLQEQIASGWNEGQIRASWQADLRMFREIRKKYLLYQ